MLERAVDDSAFLEWRSDRGEQRLVLEPGISPVVISRSSTATVQLDDVHVTRDPHAELLWANRRWWIRDLGSKNGTFVDHVPLLERAVTLKPDSTILCGQTAIHFRWPWLQANRGGYDSQPETVSAPRIQHLSEEDRAILRALCLPLLASPPGVLPTNKQLEEQLHLSYSGVRKRLQRLYPKFGLDGNGEDKRAELAALAIETGAYLERPR